MTKHVFLLWFTIGMVSYAYFAIAIPNCLSYVTCFAIDGLAPGRYRLLQPAIEYAVSQSDHNSWLFTDIILQFVLTTGTLSGLYLWLKRITEPYRAMGGVLLFAFAWVCAFSVYMRSIGTSIELCLLVWFLVFIEARLIWLALLVIVASLNRETALLLPFAYLAWNWSQRGAIRCGVLMTVYMLITAAIHIALGSANHVLGLQGTLTYNVRFLDSGLLTLFLLLPLCLLAVAQYRSAKPVYKRLAWVSGAYLIAAFVGGAWNEMLRLGLTAIILIMPMIVREGE